MFDPSKPVTTRDGRSARIICTDAEDKDYPIVALVRYGEGESIETYTPEGDSSVYCGEMDSDLINVPTVEYRALSRDRFQLGSPTSSPDDINREYPWAEKGLKFTISNEGEVIGVELA